MADIKSNHTSPLGLPGGGGVIPANGTIRVDRWEVISQHNVVKAWLAANVIEVVGTAAKPAPIEPEKPVVDEDDGDLAELRVEYQELVGKRAYHGWSAEELRQKIDTELAS